MRFPKIFTDQMGHEITLVAPPRRIISLVPSQTELLADLGLDDDVAGITKFCVHPEEWYRKKVRVGGTKTYHFDKIAELKPDLIIGNKEENDEEQIRALQKLYPVWMSDIHNLDEAMVMIRSIGMMTDRLQQANFIENTILGQFGQLKHTIQKKSWQKAAYLIWKNPYMGAGPGTFIDSMLQLLKLENVLKETRYPETTLAELASLEPEMILLSSEPYPFAEKHIQEIQSVIPGAKVILVDGEMFSWYGSRLIQAPGYFESLLAGL